MSITKARELVIRHHKYAWVLTIVAALAVGGTFFVKKDLVSAATYYFTQASWAGGPAADSNNHTSNETGTIWTTYESASSTFSAGTTLSLPLTSYTITDTSDTADVTVAPSGGPAVSGGRFTIGADDSNVAVSGSGNGASVGLAIDNSAFAVDLLDSTSVVGTDIAIDSSGYLHIAYIKSNQLYYIKQTASGWGSPSLADNTNVASLVPAIALDASNNPYIAYADNIDFSNKLTVARNVGAGWEIAVVGSIYTGEEVSIAIDSLGYPHLIYTAAVSDYYGSAYIQWNGGASWTSNWSTPVFLGGERVYGQVSIAIDSIDNVHVGWNKGNLTPRYIYYNKKTAGVWETAQGIYAAPLNSTMGEIVVDSNDNPGIVFRGGVSTIFYKKYDGSSWSSDYSVGSAGSSGGSRNHISLEFDSNNLPHIVYYNYDDDKFKYAAPTSATTWNVSNIGTITSTGGNSAMVLHNDFPQISFAKDNADLYNAHYLYYTSGTFTSGPIDLGASADFTGKTLDWSETLNGGSITMQVRAADNLAMSSGLVDWQSISNGGLLSGLTNSIQGKQYVQYKAVLTSPLPYTTTPLLNSVTVNYSQYSPLGSLVSSAYDSESDANIIGGLVWTEDTTLPSGTSATLYVRTASNSAGLSSASWSTGITSGTTGCSKSGTTVTCTANAIPAGFKDGVDDRWFQYKITLGSDGGSTPTVDDIKVVYVVNAPPAFDATYGTNGVNVSQISDSGNANWGKVELSYKIKDTDTTTGTTNAGYVTPSFEYSTNGGSSWSAITLGDLSTDATANKAVSEGSYTTYTTYWTATSTLVSAPVNIANAKIRVTINDNEAVNNTATAASANFTLDTTTPAVNGGNFTLNSSTGGTTAGTLTLTATDYSTLQYRFCNDSTFPTTDTQGNSCAWTTLGASPVASTTASWVTTGYPNTETVYAQVRDLYGNVTAQTAIAPSMPANVDYKDVSNVSIEVYREFLSWSTFTATTGNAFGSYKVYHATTTSESTLPASGDYLLLATITDSAINYYTHNVTTATSSAQHYKVVAVGTNGDISEFTAVLSDIPNGSGGQADQAPTITDTPTADLIKNTSARIAFTTNSLATSTVEYGPTSSYGSTAYQTSFVTNHSLYLNSLSPNTAYYFRAKATSAGGLDSAWAVGTTFTTAQGTVISGVTPMNVTDKTATIFWNTNASSTSKVYYGTGRSGSTLVGSVTVTGTSATTAGTNGKFQHQVGVPSSGAFTAGNTYYYKVESVDGDSNTTTDDNNGQFYSFTTTLDTTAPTISSISAAVVGPTSAVIVWTTDEPATSQVRWGGSTGIHSKRTTTDMTFAGIPSYSVYHVATLSSQTQNIGDGGGTNILVAETPYYYTAVSVDAAGNETESAEQTFTTTRTGEDVIVTVSRSLPPGADGPTPDTTAPTISNVKVSDITPFSAVVTFDTNEAAVGKLAHGKDTGYGDNAADDFSWGTSHTVKLRGLTLGTEYHIKVSAADRAGNVGTSDDQTFKTSFLSENIKELTKIENIEQFQKEIEETIESILPSLVPPFVSKPTITDITENSATVTFRTNIRSFPLIGFVEDATYDATKENPYSSEVSDTTEKNTSHTLSLLNLKSNTKYHIQARAFSLPQVVGKTDDLTFITKASKIIASIVETKRDSFTVVWITDEPTTSTVEYKNLATGITERKTDSKQTASHSMKIENLPSATTYEVIISGVNAEGNVIEGGSPLRVTTSKDVTAPVLSNFKVSNAMVPGRTDRIQTIISWTTDEPADSIVYYEEGIGTPGEEKELANKSEITDSFVTSHNIIISSLKPGAIYRIKVTSQDESGNMGVFGPRTIITPKQTESITDIIFKNFEDSFKFLRDF